MPIVKIDTGFNIQLNFHSSEFYMRALAWMIDMFFILVYSLLVRGFIMNADTDSVFEGMDNMLSYFLVVFPIFVYDLVFEIFWNGATPGKHMMKIRVISQEGNQSSISQYLLRWMFRFIDIALVFPGILCMLLSKNGQRLGDIVAGTLVISTKAEADFSETVFVEVEQEYTGVYPQVMQLQDRDINILTGILRRKSLDPYDPGLIQIANKLSRRLQVNPRENAVEFIQTLLKDYNFYTRDRDNH